MGQFSVVGEPVEPHDLTPPFTRTVRILRPGFVTIIAGHVVVVDESQPVAAGYSFGGGLVHVVGWSDLTVPPTEFTFPGRRFVDAREAVFVQDGARGTPVIAIAASSEGAASILHKQVDGSRAVICVQHCNKRPWVFAPSRTLLLVNGTGSGKLDERELVLPDISEFCFPVTLPEETFTARLVEYMQFSLGELSALHDVAWNVRLDEDIAGGLPRLLLQRSNSEVVHI